VRNRDSGTETGGEPAGATATEASPSAPEGTAETAATSGVSDTSVDTFGWTGAEGGRTGPRTGASLEAGDRVGRLVVIERLGSGGMGVVYRARDPELNREVAVKLLRPDRRGGAHDRRLMREAQALAQLSHPNVVAVYDVGVHAENVFLSMEFIDGQTLDEVLAARPHDWRAVLGLFVQAGRGLAALHEKGLVHRDVKPSNLIVDGAGRLRVSDFGLARIEEGQSLGALTRSGRGGASTTSTGAGGPPDVTLSEDGVDPTGYPAPLSATPDSDGALLASPLTQVGNVVGTPRYMAPEHHAGLATRASDQFSFCVALWEALYGEHPFGAGDRSALIAAVLAGRRRPAPRKKGVPGWLERAVARGLAVDPAARHPSMAALVDVLATRPRRRRRALLAVGLAAAALAAGGTAIGLRAVGADRAPPVDCSRAGDSGLAAWSAARPGLIASLSAPPPALSGKPDSAAASAPQAAMRADNAARIAGVIDRWSEGWRGARVEACRATHERGEQSADLLDRRMACFDRQLVSRDLLVEALARADAAVRSRALEAASSTLPDPDGCAAERLAARPAPSTDPRAVALQRELDSITLSLTLRVPDKISRAEAALAEAESLGDPRLRARARSVYGHALVVSDPVRARAELDRALSAAVDAGDPEIEAEVLFAQVSVFKRLGEPARIETILPMVAAAVQRAGSPIRLRRRLVNLEATTLAGAGKAEAARIKCDEAIRIARPEAKPALIGACDCLLPTQAARLAEAVDGCTRALASAESVYGPESPGVEAFLGGAASALERVGRYAEARPLRERQRDLTRTLQGEQSSSYAGALSALATNLRATGRIDLALPAAARAVEIREAIGEIEGDDYVENLFLLAESEVETREAARLPSAIRHAEAALALAKKIFPTEGKEMAWALMTHGQVLRHLPAQLDRAIRSLQAALALYDALPPETEQVRRALAAAQVSIALADAGRSREAVRLAERAVATYPPATTPRGDVAVFQYALGVALETTGAAGRARAIEAFAQAHAVYREVGDLAEAAHVEGRLRHLDPSWQPPPAGQVPDR
jgi:eukaryotic-like serine/threonine-protein kinase